MNVLPPVSATTLAAYLELREDYWKVVFLDTGLHGPSLMSQDEVDAQQAAIWGKVRELHRLRLAFLGQPAPGLTEWAKSLIAEAEADPKAWLAKRRRIVEQSFEMPGAESGPLLSEPVDRVTANYRQALDSASL